MEVPKLDRASLYDYSDGSRFVGKPTEDIFTEIAKENFWTESESVSGIGSAMAQTAEIRRHLPDVFFRFNIQSMLDIPCGDFNWMQHIDLANIQYTGGDIVKNL